MADKFFTSDTHFFHNNILRFTDNTGEFIRPFRSINEMHEMIVYNWNCVVKPEDKVYHLGDVTFRYDGAFNNLMKRLNGKKRLIPGNHDKIKNKSLLQHFEKVELWKGFHEKIGNTKYAFTCVHIPLELKRLRDGNICVHGHTHQNIEPDPHYINVCVEVRNYTPVSLDTILAEIKKVT